MDKTSLSIKMNQYIEIAAESIRIWLITHLSKTCPDWWQDCILPALDSRQSKNISACDHSLDYFDLRTLLSIADYNWYVLCNKVSLSPALRICLRNVNDVYNHWIFQNSNNLEYDTVSNDIDTLISFFNNIANNEVVVIELENLKFDLNFDYDSSNISSQSISSPNIHTDDISEKSMVCLTGNPSAKGVVLSIQDLDGLKKYEVFIDGSVKTFFTGQIIPVKDENSVNWIDMQTFNNLLTAHQINNPSSSNLYSLNSARIDFVPYQFRPALKLVKSDQPRILIADSVGVGKTIEAGIIIKELQARKNLNNILIICPKPLVTEKKWETEMKRFDEEFYPLDGRTLRRIIADTERDHEWPEHYSKSIIPYSILDKRVYDGEDPLPGLSTLTIPPHFDLVIIDEAHHIRNGSDDKEKAYAYKSVKYFCDNTDAVVMLTATPLQTSEDNLFTLLNVLRPDIIIDQNTFSVMSEPNAFISRCSHIVRSAGENWNEEAYLMLQNVTKTIWGSRVTSKNPNFISILNRLRSASISRDERVQLISDIEALHSFNNMLNRTRRKDIQDFCVRRCHTLQTDFTEFQKNLHTELLSFESSALSAIHGSRHVSFMMSTIRRQAASCIFGLAPFLRDIINYRLDQLNDIPDWDFEDDAVSLNEITTMARHILDMSSSLPSDDPKFNDVLQVIKQKQLLPNNKIILFSTFRHTLAYLKKKLIDNGLRVGQIDGSIKDDERLKLRNRFQLPKDHADALDIMLFTEVGSEGLDYQFCDTMINYDLPWNPMRIEQRIGRIDRRGQVSDVVNIYNVITNDTVDAYVYDRCLKRIGIFEKSIGECEDILGEIGSKIEQIVFNYKLTDAEKRMKLEQMADNEIRRIQELTRLEDEEKDLFGIDLSSHLISREIQNAESPWLSISSLQSLVNRYLSSRLGTGTYISGDSAIQRIKIPKELKPKLLEDFSKLPQSSSVVSKNWLAYLKDSRQLRSLTFFPEASSKDPSALFITAVHPLVKQAATYFSSSQTSYINLKYCSDSLPEGVYPFSIYVWNYIGISPRFKIVPVCENEDVSNNIISILFSSQIIPFTQTFSQEIWSNVENFHIRKWLPERNAHIDNVHNNANYQLMSIENNYKVRKSFLANRLQQTGHIENMRRMYTSQLNKASAEFELKKQEILSKSAQADIHTNLIVNGLLHIERT